MTANKQFQLKRKKVNNGYQYYTLEGTTSATGRAILQLGNATATGTAGRMNITGTATSAAETDVVLNLNQNAGIVWFSAGNNQNVSTYYLSLPGSNELKQSTTDNDNWVAEGKDLKLNWNIVSCSKVKIDLIVSGKLKGQNNSSNEIGWKVSFKKNSYGIPESTDTVISAGYHSLTTNTLSATAVTKNNTVYGSSGTLSIDEIITENTYEKKVDNYKATLTAKVTTTD